MKLERPTGDKDRRAIKQATHRTTALCGGQESAAMITRVNPKTLSDYGNTGNPRHTDVFMPVDVLADMILDRREAGEIAPLLAQLCELGGGVFVPVPEVCQKTNALDLGVVDLSQKLLNLVAILTQSLAENDSDYCNAKIELIKEVIHGLCALRSRSEEQGVI
ncbi:hypothetical protein PsAD46_03951 [Pseudovibrio sp. Ad46]|uniref:hypothetical protein n=1 Tax=Pseudovibrio TaxID=258255 RepID=UPI0007AE7738|nr:MULTISPECIES: hypothetical protein [Pseudovibrio]KZK80903.1 hypothetical protein PsAD46_03951 [Pseudovibrio sp. Ad46]